MYNLKRNNMGNESIKLRELLKKLQRIASKTPEMLDCDVYLEDPGDDDPYCIGDIEICEDFEDSNDKFILIRTLDVI